MATEVRRRAGRLASSGPIREAAATLFLEKGYQGTSMDDIAGAAQVSKQTIYTHFANKEDLFAQLVLGNSERVEDFVAGIEEAIQGEDLEAALGRLARRYLGFVARSEVLRLRRLIIGEAARFPDLARRYYELIPGRVYAALADRFAELQKQGRIRAGDATEAANHFAWLTLGLTLDRGMFYPVESALLDLDLDEQAAAAARVFVAAYVVRS